MGWVSGFYDSEYIKDLLHVLSRSVVIYRSERWPSRIQLQSCRLASSHSWLTKKSTR